MGFGNGSETPDPVYHCTILPRKHQAADVPWTLWVLRMVCESRKKINNDTLVSSWVNKPNRLEAACCAWRRNACLKNSAMTELNQLSNTMNVTCEKINNNTLSSWVRKQCGLGTSGCSWGEYAYLKNSAIAKLNELSNTMNVTSMLQGQDPPPLFKVIHDIWNIF